jgi:hypothetical protein
MPFCQACGSSVASEARFCAACGKPIKIGRSSNSTDLVATASAAVAPIETNFSTLDVGLFRTPVGIANGAQPGEKAIHAHRPLGVTMLAVLTFLVMIPTVSLGMVALTYVTSANAEGAIPQMRLLMQLFPVLAHGQEEMVSQGSEVAATMLAIAAISAALSYGLWKLRKWGRNLAMLSSVLLSVHAAAMVLASSGTLLWHVFVIGINIWIVMYLQKPPIKRAFGA